MQILLLMIAYPDVRENSSMYTDLANEFALRGHDVYVAVANGQRPEYFGIEGRVKVLRVKTLELFNSSFIIKGIANILLPLQMIRAIDSRLMNIKFDSIILSTPPITYLKVAEKFKHNYNSKIYLILRDIFPQNAKDLGLIKNKFIIRYFRQIEKRLYNLADSIGCMSKGNIDYIKTHNPEVSSEKLHLLYNWINPSSDIRYSADLKIQSGFNDKFIIVYGGNLGKPQDVDFIIELSSSLKDLKDVIFLIIGDGTEKKRMSDISASKKLGNILFWDPLPRHEFEKYIKICDIGLVVNSRKFTIPNIPSRVLSYWNAQLPVLATLDPYTDFGEMLNESNSGFWSMTGDISAFRTNFEKLYYNPGLRSVMGKNGLNFLLNKCTAEKAYNTIINKLN